MTKQNATKGTAEKLAIESYRLACKYRRFIKNKWEPRLPEIRKRDEWNRTSIAWENDETRAAWLCEETGQLVLRALRGVPPCGLDPFKSDVFEKCRNRLWKKALESYKKAVAAVSEEGSYENV